MRTIFVDSRDRVSGSQCDFVVQLPQTLTLTNQMRMRTDLLRVPVSVPTIQGGKNDTIIVVLGATSYTVTIPQGQYDGPTLASTIQTRLTAAAPGSWTVTYDVSNISMKIQCSNNFTITGGSYAAQLMSRAYTQTANSYNFSYVSVVGEDVVFLTSPTFSSLDNVGPGGSHDLLLACNITAPFGSVQEFNAPYDVWLKCPSLSTSQLSFQLRDRSYGLMTNFIPNVSFLLTIDDGA
jgi:hypothetical protein